MLTACLSAFLFKKYEESICFYSGNAADVVISIR